MGCSIFERGRGFHAFLLFSQQLVGDIDGCQNGNPVGGNNGGTFGDLVHSFINESRNFLNILGIVATLEGVLLAEDCDCHALRFQLGPLPAKSRLQPRQTIG
ncbi:MAG: hypothetical protein ABFS42_00630 [Candidatus Krumholzibacteriota bacterium]